MSDPLFQAGRNCWRVERATRASIIVDAADYFTAARAAMLKARHRIMLVGWDFDARIELGDGAEGGPKTVGEFVIWLVDRTPGLEVYLLRWDLGALKMLWQGSTIFTLFKWMRHPRIHTRLDGAHPVGASHHQKIVAIDDCFAFCGGIDVTSNRWDTREHNDDDPRRVQPNGKPHGPWHDATSALEGPVAAALGELCRDRWHRAGGAPLDPVPGVDDCWPDPLPVDFNGIEVAVARTAPDMPDYPAVHEIEQLYIDMIRRARHFIYAESQYFASRRIAEAIALRLDEADGPEIVVINPVVAQGWLEPLAMDTARARLFEALRRRDAHARFHLYHPHTSDGTPIYVHAKVMIVDDEILRVGSSNINNRSLRLDTECDIAIDASRDGSRDSIACIHAIRVGLLAEHLAVEVSEVDEALTGTTMFAAIEALRSRTDRLRRYTVPDLSSVEAWLADNEVLDPEGPDEMFEVMAKRGLFRRILHLRGGRRG